MIWLLAIIFSAIAVITTIIAVIGWHFWDFDDICWGIVALSLVIALLFIGSGFLVSYAAKKKALEYQETYKVLQSVIANGTDLENAGLTQTVMKYNDWLVKANTDKEMWGCLSVYAFVDLGSLQYIQVSAN